jgi:hypothetical protein
MLQPRFFRVIEIVIGFVIPCLLGGPAVLLGLADGIGGYRDAWKMPYPDVTRQMARLSLYPAIGGIIGLASLFILLFFGKALRRNWLAAALVTTGVAAGACVALWVLEGIVSMEIRYPTHGVIDRKAVLVFSLILLPPIIVSVRRLRFLWRVERPDTHVAAD